MRGPLVRTWWCAGMHSTPLREFDSRANPSHAAYLLLRAIYVTRLWLVAAGKLSVRNCGFVVALARRVRFDHSLAGGAE